MPKPRIFVSSTYYDLKHLRADFDDLGVQIGFEPVLFEHGKIAYDGTVPLEQSIFREIELSDIVVSIIGGRYGSRSVEKSEYSITEREIRHALELGKQMFFFVDAGVRTASEIYLDNEQLFQESKKLGEGLKWRHVENIEVFHLIKFIESLNKNNAIFNYETSTEVMTILREQLAGLFKSLLQKQSRDLINSHVSGLVEAITKVENIVEYFKKQEASDKETMDDILFSNHPLFKKLQNALNLST